LFDPTIFIWSDFNQNIAGPFPAGKNERLELDFLTPFQMKINPVKKSNLYFYTLATYLLTRLDIFSYVFCGRKLEVDLKGLVARSHFIRSKEKDLVQVTSERAGLDIYYKVGGFVGSIVYEGDLEEFYPFVVLGQYLHAGKGATYGYGKYRINKG
jgi:hypothetical protein